MLFSVPFDDNSPRVFRVASVSLAEDLKAIEIGHNRASMGLRQIMKRDVFILHYVIRGKGEYCGMKLSENTCYIVIPNEHENIVADTEDPYETCWVMFRGSRALDFLKKCNLPCHNGVFEFNRVAEAVEILKNVIFNNPSTNEYEEAATMNAALYQIMALHFAEYSSNAMVDTVSRKVKKYIDENYYNNISVNSISRNFNFSRNYLYTLFKNDYGVSLQDYIMDLRVERAKELLLGERHLLISEVALAVGYTDAFYFSRIFKKKTGMSPSEFVKKNTQV